MRQKQMVQEPQEFRGYRVITSEEELEQDVIQTSLSEEANNAIYSEDKPDKKFLEYLESKKK